MKEYMRRGKRGANRKDAEDAKNEEFKNEEKPPVEEVAEVEERAEVEKRDQAMPTGGIRTDEDDQAPNMQQQE